VATSSAKPARLLAYRDSGLSQVVGWESEVPNLRTALTDLRRALRGLDLPEELDLFVPYSEIWFDTLARNQRHLDEWVGDVADEFIRASGAGPSDYSAGGNVDRIVTTDNSRIQVGSANRAESESQARQDARAIAAILGDYGLVHPDAMWFDNEDLRDLVGRYPELADILARSERFANDENYAVTLVNTIGPRDVRTMVDLVNTYGFADDADMIEGAYDGYVVPLAGILGAASRSGRMGSEVRAAILDLDATDEEPIRSYEYLNLDEVYQLEEMRHRSLAVVLGAGGFSSQMTADMANLILNEAPENAAEQGVVGFVDRAFLQDHRELASNQWAALAALEGNDEAANIFFGKDDNGDGTYGNLEVMADWGDNLSTDLAAQRLGEPHGSVADDINQTVANTLRGGLLEYPLIAGAQSPETTSGATYSPETLDLVTQMMETAAADDMNTSAPVRAALAQVSAPYTLDIAYAAEGNDPLLGQSRLPGLGEGTVDGFMQEVSESEGGRVALAQNAAGLVRSQIDLAVPLLTSDDPDAFGNGTRLGVAYYRELGEAWRAVDVGRVAQHEALVAGWRSYTDPLVDIVSGKIVEKIPVVNLATDLPVAGTFIDNVTGDIKDSINDAAYDHLIPPPDRLASMEQWADGVGDDVRTAIAASLYDNPQSRQVYLGQAPGYPGQDASVWDEINRDGVVELGEFQRLEVVQNTVNARADQILAQMQAEMAFNQVFRDP
jgi:hypothetical protein